MPEASPSPARSATFIAWHRVLAVVPLAVAGAEPHVTVLFDDGRRVSLAAADLPPQPEVVAGKAGA